MQTSPIILLLTLIVLTFLFFSCKSYTVIPSPQPSLQDQLTITRSTKGTYTFEFLESGLYKVYVGDNPSSIDWFAPLFETQKSTVVRTDLPVDKRLYFGVVGPDDIKFISSERRISVYSIANLRDLGGIPTEDERIVQWGRLYKERS